MSGRRPEILAAALMAASLVLPLGEPSWLGEPLALGCAVLAVVAGVAGAMRGASAPIALVAGAAVPLLLLREHAGAGWEAPGLWLFLGGLCLELWAVLTSLARHRRASLLAAGLFGLAILYLWQVLVVGFAVPQVLLPAPSQVGHILVTRYDVLWDDFQQTFLKSVLSGFAFGCASGFVVAILIDRSPFLQRGLLPLSGLVSAMPIVGIAPIMVMWFGFGWESKAAVIVVMTFFPMLVNTRAGLADTDAMQRDLMHSYAAGYWPTLLKLRLPAALPFIFNALKINSTLALIGAIVAEFFGSPILGLGFRISTEVAKLNVDVVWAVIAIAAVAGSAFYGVIAAIERVFTFWHPSLRH